MKNNKGLILTEVLVTIAILSGVVLALSSIINGSVVTTQWSESDMIAGNLATEAIEGIKNLRDTNWLQAPHDDSCWMRVDPKMACTNLVSKDMSYTVQQNSDDQWTLANVNSNALSLADNKKGLYVLYIDKVGDLDGYVHSSGVESQFYRGVTFTEVSADKVVFNVSVQWYEGAKIRKLDREMILYNFR